MGIVDVVIVDNVDNLVEKMLKNMGNAVLSGFFSNSGFFRRQIMSTKKSTRHVSMKCE